MRIGELAKRSGLAASRIRFYEASGLLNGVHRQANGYREYVPETVRVLELIACAQQSGFSLEEIRRMMPPSDRRDWHHDTLLAGLKSKLAEIEALQQRLAQNREQLLEIIHGIEHKPEALSCEDHSARLMAKFSAQRIG